MREAFSVLQFMILLMWPMSVWAAGATLGNLFSAHSAADWGAVMLITTISGMVALMTRIRKSMEADAKEKLGQPFEAQDKMLLDWRTFAIFHMVGSYAAGLTMFMIAEHLEWDSYVEALAITAVAWVGAQFMDKLAGEGTNRIMGVVSLLFNGKQQPPPPPPPTHNNP